MIRHHFLPRNWTQYFVVFYCWELRSRKADVRRSILVISVWYHLLVHVTDTRSWWPKWIVWHASETKTGRENGRRRKLGCVRDSYNVATIVRTLVLLPFATHYVKAYDSYYESNDRSSREHVLKRVQLLPATIFFQFQTHVRRFILANNFWYQCLVPVTGTRLWWSKWIVWHQLNILTTSTEPGTLRWRVTDLSVSLTVAVLSVTTKAWTLVSCKGRHRWRLGARFQSRYRHEARCLRRYHPAAVRDWCQAEVWSLNCC